MINETTHKQCPECLSGFVFAYEGAEPEPCPNCDAGFIELSEDEELELEREHATRKLHTLNAKLTRRI